MTLTIPNSTFTSSMEDHHHLFQPPTTTDISGEENYLENDHITATLPTSSIVLRLVSVLLISIISIWANYEASKGFEISIINDIPNTLAGRRFDLLYVSNDKATRIVLSTSEFATGILYADTDFQTKKPISHVTVKLTGRNLTNPVVVSPIGKDEYMVEISVKVMEESNFEASLVSAMQRGMSRVWISSTEAKGVPQSITDAIVEYISIAADGFNHPSVLFLDSGRVPLPESESSCWKSLNPVAMAKFFSYCEKVKEGFIQRLNQATQENWNERTVDNALGIPAQELCKSYYSSDFEPHNSTNPDQLMVS